ncbi:DAP3-binding cell death enhancer 1-like [Coregonus clupeaformis]|uniref:DAP3-binding cell death enhancer 1-like n=1 Tax=Coregonus clupeaformis TaxID=59861 RepID=UPI001E1C524C|nr:DAP3-binding cell death enhancer 1-like [Coregonus clupeaformis]
MWRVQGFVGRVFSRCHGNAPLRLSQNHHVEDEVINTSTFLGRHSPDSSSQKGEDGDKRWKKRTSQFCYSGLPRYTALDAVGWGAAAVLLIQICKKVHSQFSSGAELNPNTGCLAIQGTLQKFDYRVLLEIRELCHNHYNLKQFIHELPNTGQEHSSSSSSNSFSSPGQLHGDVIADGFLSDHHDSSGREETSFSKSSHPEDKHRARKREQPPQQNEQDALAGAAQNLQQVADSSVPVVLNIIGLESAQTGDYDAAFSCFLASAKRGYCKAQFNTGVCYEKGRGVSKDLEKALHFYGQAASGGHSQAQYRCAKLLLSSRGQQSTRQDLDTAISLLQQAASAGLREAQVYLGSLFSQEPVRDGRKSVHYLKMAAESGDSEALLFLGQCYESGFGVPQCFRTAVGFYQRAAQAGNSQAKTLLTPPYGVEEEAVLRSIRSSPCFSVVDHLRKPLSTLASPVPPSSRPTLPLPHSWSTGSMGPPPTLSFLPLPLHPPSSEGNAVRWTIGVG